MVALDMLSRDQDFYVPYFEVRLGNKPLPRDAIRDVLQVSYRDNLIDIDKAELTVNNWDAEDLRFKYSDEMLFVPGKPFELWLGYYGKANLHRVFQGEIVSLKPTFPAGGPPTLAVEALDILHKFRRKQETQTYTERTDSQIAEVIGERLHIKVKTDPKESPNEKPYPYILQDNQYDIVFLLERAARIGYDLTIQQPEKEEPYLTFGPSQGLRPAEKELTYGKSLIEFSTNLSTALQVSKVTVQGWHPTTKESIRYTADRSQLDTKGVGAQGNQQVINDSFRDREEVITDKPIANLKEAETLARETLEKISKEMLVGTGSTVGQPDIRAGSVLHLKGLGARFSGRYFVTSTTHTLGDSGYTTQFECRREELRG